MFKTALILGIFCMSASSSYAVRAGRLSSLVVRVNDEEKTLANGESFQVLRGDKLIILYATLAQSAKGPNAINLVGYRRVDIKTRPGDDRDILIDTNELLKKWSIDTEGREYRITAKSGRTFHGEVKILVEEPILKSIDITVNDELRTLKPNDILDLKATDIIKVRSIHTNDSRLDREAQIRFEQEANTKDGKRMALKLRNRETVFASVYFNIKP